MTSAARRERWTKLSPEEARLLDRAIRRWAPPWAPAARKPFHAALAACRKGKA